MKGYRPERATLLPRSLEGGPRPSGRYGASDPEGHRIASYAVHRTRSLERWFSEEDRYQTAWLAMLEAQPHLRSHGSRAYLRMRAFGGIVDELRKSSRLNGSARIAGKMQAVCMESWAANRRLDEIIDSCHSPEDEASLREAFRWIESLPPLDRDLALAAIDGTTLEEIADAHAIHIGRVIERWQWLKRQIRLRYVGLFGELSESDELALACKICAEKTFGEATQASHALHLGDAERLALGLFRRGW